MDFTGRSEFMHLLAALPLIVMIPGAGSSGDRIYINGLSPALSAIGGDHYFKKLQDDFEAAGMDAMICPKAADKDMRTVEERAEDCVQQILTRRDRCDGNSARDILLFGHSMGGLVARTLAQDPSVQSCIHSVTTISTPHQGTPIADWAIDHAGDPSAFDIFGSIVRAIHFEPTDLHYLPELKLTRTGADPALFRAQDLPDNTAVTYYSVTTSQDFIPIPFLEASRHIIVDELNARGFPDTPYGTKNDGIVPEYSQVHGINVGHVDSHHFGAACVDPVKLTPECRRASAFLVDHFTKIWPR
jgi:hypothetical protein